ncbi:MAG: UvrD-helicase domain-containing protein [Bacteroidaceae bacterium]|nr:UvrD-helicase domain-containing protein [Bacteroidaceae bacterium]
MQNSLSKVQLDAVEYIDGPSLVIAGAGSGKTRVLTYKIAYLLQKGYKPWNILALTFTNKAAREMKERIAKIVGEDKAQYLVMGTFHSIFARILRYESDRLGFDRNYTIYDDADSRTVIKNATKEVFLAKGATKEQLETAMKAYKPQTVASSIGLAKNRMLTAEQYAQNKSLREYDTHRRMPEIYNIYKVYERILVENNAMDFDDLLLKTYLLLKNNEDVRQKYAAQFQYVLVDEYQDTNAVQQKILELLVKEHHKVCVVGDDAQSIYAFRGANIDNILDFSKVFPELRMFKLEENYRSTKNIVAAANDLISHNQRQIRKNVFSNNVNGDKPQLIKTASDELEAKVVQKRISRLHAVEHIPYDEMVILYRTNAQSRKFEDEFRKERVPYKIYGGMSFYQRAEIKNILAYFRLVVNTKDDEAAHRIINYPKRGIGQTTVEKVMTFAQSRGESFYSVISLPQHFDIGLNKGTQTKINDFVSLIEDFRSKLSKMDAATLGRYIIQKSGISEDLYADRTTVEGEARIENLQELYSSMQEFVDSQKEEGKEEQITLADFLSQAALQTDQESVDAADDNQPKVTLMTMHGAKGLEFDTVFIVGLEEEIFPSPRSVDSQRALEEERRLLYVAITRAKKRCYLTHAESRYLYGQWMSNPRSRFLNDINPSLLDCGTQSKPSGYPRSSGNTSFTQTKKVDRSLPFGNFRSLGSSSTPRNFEPSGSRAVSSTSTIKPQPSTPTNNQGTSSTSRLSIGAIVEHTRFGRGKILNIEGTGDNTKALVDFENVGKKQLLLKFAFASMTVISH